MLLHIIKWQVMTELILKFKSIFFLNFFKIYFGGGVEWLGVENFFNLELLFQP